MPRLLRLVETAVVAAGVTGVGMLTRKRPLRWLTRLPPVNLAAGVAPDERARLAEVSVPASLNARGHGVERARAAGRPFRRGTGGLLSLVSLITGQQRRGSRLTVHNLDDRRG